MPMNDRERQVLKMQNYSSLKDAQRGNVLLPACPSRLILGHLTSGWGVLVLVALRTGTKRFNQLRREIEGVSERMLSQTLQHLERDGMVNRKSINTAPPYVEYSLTVFGQQASEKYTTW